LILSIRGRAARWVSRSPKRQPEESTVRKITVASCTPLRTGVVHLVYRKV
jgi:hypothetical protein